MDKLEIVLGNKWRINGEKSGQNFSSFGYYDVVGIKSIKRWHQFRPAFDRDAFCSKEGEKNNIRNIYTIRLFRTSTATYAEREQVSGEVYPICACAFFHCSDSYLQFLARGNHRKWMGESIIRTGKLQEEFEGVLETWQCIGYFDYALILYAKKVSTIIEFIDKIKAKHKPSLFSSSYTILGYNESQLDKLEDDEKISVKMEFSFGVDVPHEDELDALQAFAQKLSVSNASISVPQINLGKHDWHLVCQNMSLKDFLIKHCALCGENDALSKISPEERIQIALRELKDVKTEILPEANNKSVYYGCKKIKKKAEVDDSVKHAFEQFKGFYETLKKAHGAHSRPLRALEYLTELYHRAGESRYGEDVAKIIGNFFVSFLTTLSAMLDHMERCPSGSVRDGNGEFYNINTYVELIENSIKHFRDAVEPLLADILKSDCGEFENLTTNHFSIGSATKLLFAYNATIAEWESNFLQWAKEHGKSELIKEDTGFCYLITSGGIDQTKHLDLFNCNHDVLKKYGVFNGEITYKEEVSSEQESLFEPLARPIIVFASEGSLYDVKGTLLRLAHEFFHKRGDRARKLRAEDYHSNLWEIFFEHCKNIFPVFFLNKAARRFYEEMVRRGNDKTFSKDMKFKVWKSELHRQVVDHPKEGKPLEKGYSDAWEYLNNIYSKMFSSKALEEANKEFLDVYSGERGTICIENEIANLEEKISEKLTKRALEKNLTVRELLFGNRIYNELGVIFETTLQKSKIIYSLALELFCAYSKKIKQALPSPTFFDAYSLSFLDDPNTLEYENDWKQIVQTYLNGETLSFTYLLKVPNLVEDICTDEDYYKYFLPFDVIRQNLAILYKECYADCMAVHATNLHYSKSNWKGFLQYIFCFLFEKQNFKALFYNNGVPIDGNTELPIDFETYSMRIGVVAEICWEDIVSNPKEFFVRQRKEIVKTIKEYYDMTIHPNEGIAQQEANAYAEGLCDILLRILQAYKKWKSFKYFDRLIKYLKACIQENGGKDNDDSLLGKICGTMEDVFSVSDEDETYINFIFGKWLSLFKE